MQMNTRRRFLKSMGLGFLSTPALNNTFVISWIKEKFCGTPPGDVYFTTGFKVMEVDQTRAIVWTRLCGQEFPNPIRHERREQVFRHPVDFNEDQHVDQMDGAVTGTAGKVRFRLLNGKEKFASDWITATADNDFTASFVFEQLLPDRQYRIEVEGKSLRGGKPTIARGVFKTMPDPLQVKPVNLVTSTCQYFWSFDDEKRGFKTYDSMRRLKPDFFIHTGDYVYYDKPGPMATTLEKARHKWHAMDSWPAIREFYETSSVFMMKDDHDLLKNDVYPGISPFGSLNYQEGLDLWRENVPLNDKPYRTIRWGKDVQIWMVEGREFRSPNDLPDSPAKTIWGEEQKQWFQSTLESSDATFKLLFTPTPIVGPDRPQKKDNHANRVYQNEGDWLREYLSQFKGLFVVNGDRHWQYVSKDLETGLFEFGSGPVSDYHAQGWDPNEKKPEHRFLRLKGGFLNIKVDRDNDRAFIEFVHCDVDGNEVHREKFS